MSGLAPAPSLPTGLKLTAPGNSLGGTYFLLLSLRCPLDPQFWSWFNLMVPVHTAPRGDFIGSLLAIYLPRESWVENAGKSGLGRPRHEKTEYRRWLGQDMRAPDPAGQEETYLTFLMRALAATYTAHRTKAYGKEMSRWLSFQVGTSAESTVNRYSQKPPSLLDFWFVFQQVSYESILWTDPVITGRDLKWRHLKFL